MYKEYVVKVWDNGNKEWFLKDLYHREDGPAIEYATGTKIWMRNGLYHREDGPAIERANGVREWFVDGQAHREDGPAFMCRAGLEFWFLKGKEYTKEEFLKKTAVNKPATCEGKVVEIEGKKYKLTEV